MKKRAKTPTLIKKTVILMWLKLWYYGQVNAIP